MTHFRVALARVALILLLAAVARSASAADPVETAEWTHTEGAAGGGRFSELTDITAANVSQLEVAWHYEHADFWEGRFPLKVNGGTNLYEGMTLGLKNLDADRATSKKRN